jgi:tRNA threonylcarbamoyl adenosine modification protein YeaZ
MFLAIDSSAGTSVAIVDGSGVTLAHCSSHDPRGHAENIGVLLQRALEEAGVHPADLTSVVMGVGPGPFTGLRVGMAAASAFAHSRGIPLLPVISHDAYGWHSDKDCVVITDARRGEVAVSYYQVAEKMRRTLGPFLAKPAELDELLGDARSVLRVSLDSISAADLARAALAFQAGGLSFPNPSPVYLRAPDVTVKP